MKKPSDLKTCESGAVYVEAAFVMIFLVIAFIGVLQIADYVYVKQKTNKVSDDLAALLSTIPNYTPESVQTLMNAAEAMATPEGVTVSAVFCQGGRGYQSPVFTATARGGACGLLDRGQGGGGNIDTSVSCASAQYNGQAYGTAFPRPQFVVVRSGCSYKAGIRLFSFLADGPIYNTAFTEMRNTIPEFQ